MIPVVRGGMQSNINIWTFEEFQKAYFLEKKCQNAQVCISIVSVHKLEGT